MRVEHLAKFGEHIAKLVRRRFVAKSDLSENEHPVTLGPIDQFHIGEGCIGNRDEGPVESTNLGGADADVLHETVAFTEGAEVADLHRLVDEQD